jgi:hypothetical protein
VAGPQRLQGADDGNDGLVAAAVHDGIVESTADLGELGPVFQMRFHRVVDLFELSHDGVGAVGSLSGQGRARGLQFEQRGAQVGDDNRLALQQQTQHVGGAGLGRRVHDGAAAVAAPNRDQALGLQNSQRLAQRDQADIELLDEDFLPRQQIAVRQLAVDDLPPQLVCDDLGDPRRRQSAPGLGANSQSSHLFPAAERPAGATVAAPANSI